MEGMMMVWSDCDTIAKYPDNTYTSYGRRSVHNLAELLGIVQQAPTVVSVINRAYDEIVFLRTLVKPGSDSTENAESTSFYGSGEAGVSDRATEVRFKPPLPAWMKDTPEMRAKIEQFLRFMS